MERQIGWREVAGSCSAVAQEAEEERGSRLRCADELLHPVMLVCLAALGSVRDCLVGYGAEADSMEVSPARKRPAAAGSLHPLEEQSVKRAVVLEQVSASKCPCMSALTLLEVDDRIDRRARWVGPQRTASAHPAEVRGRQSPAVAARRCSAEGVVRPSQVSCSCSCSSKTWAGSVRPHQHRSSRLDSTSASKLIGTMACVDGTRCWG